MGSLKQQLNDDIKTAMRSQDRQRLGTLRLISAAIKQKEVDERIELDDTQVLAILDKLSKQHKDSIQQYESAGRDDLVTKEKAELEIVQSYLPQQLSEKEVLDLVEKAIKSSGASGMQDMGKIMGELKPQLQGRADMSAVSSLVKTRLSS